MEGLSYLGDDAGVRDIFEQARQAGELDQPQVDPHLFHFAAVAEARLGDRQTGEAALGASAQTCARVGGGERKPDGCSPADWGTARPLGV